MFSGIYSGIRSGVQSGLDAEEGDTSTTLAIASFADSADPAPGNANFTYTLQVHNSGSSNAASNVSAVVTLDSSLTFVSAAGTGWTCLNSGQVVTCTRASIAAGVTSNTITVTVTPTNADASISSTAHASADNAADTGNSTQGTTITGWATLTINSFTDSADPVMTAAPYSYACAVRNTDAVNTASTVSAVITIPANTTFVSASGTGWTCVNSSGVVTCTRASIAPSTTSNTITVNVTSAVAAETSSATASVSAANAAGSGNTTQTTGVQLVTKDATDGRRYPATSAEWTSLIACNSAISTVAVPTGLWLCQDASGNAAAAIGATALTAGTTPNYQVAISGLTRVGLQCRDNTADQFAMASGVGPNPTTTSQTWMCVARMPATPAATRTDFMGVNISSTTTECKLTHLITTGTLNMRCVGVSTAGSTSVSSTTDIFAVTYDRTNAVANGYCQADKMVGTYSVAVSDGSKGIGRGCNATYAYVAMWSGANGELSSTLIKAIMTALGWSPTFTP